MALAQWGGAVIQVMVPDTVPVTALQVLVGGAEDTGGGGSHLERSSGYLSSSGK